MRKKFPAAAFILALLFLAVTGTLVVNLGKANPYSYEGDVPPDTDTKPPIIVIFSPQNNTIYNTDTISFNFTVRVGESKTASYTRIMKVYYITDWQQNESYVYNNKGVNIPYEPNAITDFSCSINLTGLTDGMHSIEVHAVEWGAYIDGLSVHMFSINGSSSASFTIDTTPPDISVLTMKNKIIESSDVPLDFSVNEPVSQISYVLDGQDNVKIGGNTTLSGLSVGAHNVTVYAWDHAGNIGSSETIVFTVAEKPFPAAPIAVASGATITVVGVALVVYFKKRNH